MRLGDLSTPIYFEEQTITRNALGTVVKGGWTTRNLVYARVEPLPGNENVVAGQVQTSKSYRIQMPYEPGITNALRIRLLDGKLLDILDVSNDKNRNIELILICKESLSE